MTSSILYVEDEQDYQILVQRILARAGLTIRIVETVQAAEAAMRLERPSLLLLDINLPDTDGYSFCQTLRQDPAWWNLPILLLTIRRRPEEWLRGFSSGANDYIPKPINPAELVERVKNTLAGNTSFFTGQETAEYALIRAAVAGNRPAYEVLIRKYRERLRDNLRQTIQSDTLLEDLVAQTFAHAYEKLDHFRGDSTFYTWLYRIAANESSRLHRKPDALSLDQLTHGDDGILAPSGPSEVFEETVAKSESQRYALGTLDYLRPHHRQILELFFLEDLTYEAISKKLRIPLGTVMSRLHAARRFLKIAWAERAPQAK